MREYKIAIVIPHLGEGGAQRSVLTLADSMQSLGHQVYIICFEYREELIHKTDAKILYFEKFHNNYLGFFKFFTRLHNFLLAKRLDRFINRYVGMPDMTLSNVFKIDQIMTYSRLPNVHFIIHNMISHQIKKKHSLFAVSWWRKHVRCSVYRRKPCICVSKGILADLIRLIPNHCAILYIPNAINTKYINLESQSDPCPYEKFVVHIGRFIPQKRHDLLLRAYAASDIKMPLVLMGHGRLKSKTQKLAHELGISDKVIFTGFHANPYPILANACLLLLSSDYEGLPIVLLESLALGIPTISTDCDSGPREILPVDNLVPVDSLEAMAKKIRHAATNPDAYRHDLPSKFHCDEIAQAHLRLAAHKPLGNQFLRTRVVNYWNRHLRIFDEIQFASLKDTEKFIATLLAFSKNQIIKQSKRSVLFRFHWGGEVFVVKRYRARKLRYLWHSFIHGRSSLPALHNILRLREYAISTLIPVLLIEQRFFLFPGDTFLVTREIQGENLNVYLDRHEDRLPDIQLQGLLSMFKYFYGAGFIHGDLSPPNIMITSDGPVMIDLDRMSKPAPNKFTSLLEAEREKFLDELSPWQETRAHIAAIFPPLDGRTSGDQRSMHKSE